MRNDGRHTDRTREMTGISSGRIRSILLSSLENHVMTLSFYSTFPYFRDIPKVVDFTGRNVVKEYSPQDHSTILYNFIFPFLVPYMLSRHSNKYHHKKEKCSICQTIFVTHVSILLILSHCNSSLQTI